MRSPASQRIMPEPKIMPTPEGAIDIPLLGGWHAPAENFRRPGREAAQAKDVRAAVGSRYGEILPAEGQKVWTCRR